MFGVTEEKLRRLFYHAAEMDALQPIYFRKKILVEGTYIVGLLGPQGVFYMSLR